MKNEKIINLKEMLDKIYKSVNEIYLENEKLSPEIIKNMVEKKTYSKGYNDGHQKGYKEGYDRAIDNMKGILDKDLDYILDIYGEDRE